MLKDMKGMELPGSDEKLLSQMVRWVNGLPELKQALDIISTEIRRLSSSDRVTTEEVQSLGSSLTQVRLLMNELYRSWNDGNVAGIKMSGEFLRLEGLINILRNDLDQITMRIGS